MRRPLKRQIYGARVYDVSFQEKTLIVRVQTISRKKIRKRTRSEAFEKLVFRGFVSRNLKTTFRCHQKIRFSETSLSQRFVFSKILLLEESITRNFDFTKSRLTEIFVHRKVDFSKIQLVRFQKIAKYHNVFFYSVYTLFTVLEEVQKKLVKNGFEKCFNQLM